MRRAVLLMLLAAGCTADVPAVPLPDLAHQEKQVAEKILAARAAVAADPGAATWLHYGRVLYAHDRRELAQRALLEAAEFPGEHRFECLYLAGVAASTVSAGAAVELMERALEIRDDYAPAHLRCGILCEVVGDTDRAERHFRRALARERTSHALLGLARVARARGEPTEALRLLREARDLDPGHAEVLVLLARTLHELGQPDAARRAAAAVLPRHTHTSLCDPIVLRARAEGVAYVHLVEHAERAAAAGDMPGAFSFLDRAIAASPETVAAHVKKGRLLEALGRYEDALAAYRDAARADPGRGEVLSHIGRCLESLGRVRDAERAYREAVAVQPGSTVVRHALAVFLADHDPAEARAILAAVVREAPDQFGSRMVLARLLERDGAVEDARAQIEAVLEHDPENREALATLQRLRR